MLLDGALEKLKELNAKRVFVQYPDGITAKLPEISKELESAGFECVFCLNTTFGACDVRESEAKLMKCDAILHIGHADYGVKTEIPVVYTDYFIEADPVPTLEKNFSAIEKFQKFGVVASLQFANTIPAAEDFLRSKGKHVMTYKSQKYPGQILGCRVGAGLEIEDKVDCLICISAGKFYGLGLALQAKKPMFNLDLERGTLKEMVDDVKKVQKLAAWNMSALKDAKRVGFLLTWKRGQMFGSPFILKRKLEKEGKEVLVFAMDEVTPEKLEGLKLDALVSFACPRIGTDDLDRYKIPLVNYAQLMRSSSTAVIHNTDMDKEQAG
jgi:2-(3-amino-3-carboxypropyl)histidine synthase